MCRQVYRAALNITLEPGQFKIVTGIQSRIKTELSQVDVKYDPVQVATEQLKAEEHQRVFGFVPNFYVTYEKDPAPLTAKMKFRLALKVTTDPITAVGIFGVAGIRQAADSPNTVKGGALMASASAQLQQMVCRTL